MSYDEKCYQLAEQFLSEADELSSGSYGLSTETKCDKLAQEIQDVIEAFIAHAKDNYEPPDDPVAWSGGFAANH